ncbi:MAG: hypothetical protein ACXABI_14705 [Candidatus Hodarchaeales archaeon]|jgi:hypothetical protein
MKIIRKIANIIELLNIFRLMTNILRYKNVSSKLLDVMLESNSYGINLDNKMKLEEYSGKRYVIFGDLSKFENSTKENENALKNSVKWYNNKDKIFTT